MCGVVGIYDLSQAPERPVEEGDIRQMLATIRHRGPDQFGVYLADGVGLGNARLSIIDISSGQQPIPNEDETMWIVFNGEVFNYVELRPELEALGHRFTTNSDTEVILHAYEAWGADCVKRFNGQFVFAIYDLRRHHLFIARDRLGVRPLFYTVRDGRVLFASEMKAILALPGMNAEIDLESLNETFTFWSPLPPKSIFKGIFQLPPGHHLSIHEGEMTIAPYYETTFVEDAGNTRSFDDYLAEFRELLIDAARIRLRADVPVGAYLSGGLDSSTITAIIRKFTSNHLNTFSITFDDPLFDESQYQLQMSQHLQTDHQIVHATHQDIGEVFPEVVWHTESPLLRTSPAPMYLLSRLVRKHNFKVVMTGEGADEFLAGYDIFKEDRIRRFWAKQPESALRPSLLRKLYPDIQSLNNVNSSFLQAFFQQGLTDTHKPHYSHMLRWRNTNRARRFFRDEVRSAVPNWEANLEAGSEALGLRYPKDFASWHPLHRAQYLEISIFLSHYLLSSQGDRPAMANSVEGRYPFLDYRVVEFCNRLPPDVKLYGMTEKYLLKQLAREWIPDEIWKRNKRPYRAPIHRSFFNKSTEGYVREMLSEEHVRDTGYFNPAAVASLVRKLDSGQSLGETDDMALVGVLSTQLVHEQFIANFRHAPTLTPNDDVKVVVQRTTLETSKG
jgi:asparagine synthase (glutamine-hydrolysing)